jgi:O6-methylguanine-DNA--protein-cysteine methyltransferase
MLMRELAQVEAARGGSAREDASLITEQLAHELAEYFAGRRMAFGVPLDLVGTLFQDDASRSRSSCPATA